MGLGDSGLEQTSDDNLNKFGEKTASRTFHKLNNLKPANSV